MSSTLQGGLLSSLSFDGGKDCFVLSDCGGTP